MLTSEINRKADMHIKRVKWGLFRFGNETYAFGGLFDQEDVGQGETRDIHTKSAEVYSIKTYKWTKLPGMPQFASKISCAR